MYNEGESYGGKSPAGAPSQAWAGEEAEGAPAAAPTIDYDVVCSRFFPRRASASRLELFFVFETP